MCEREVDGVDGVDGVDEVDEVDEVGTITVLKKQLSQQQLNSFNSKLD